jgi:hypothetical protein
MATSEPTSTLERLEDRSLRWQTRFYLERLAFTQRGRFAFIAALLMTMHERIGRIMYEGVPSASRDLEPATGFVESAVQVGGGVLSVGTAVLAGVVVLVMLDVYEDEFGTLVE